MSCEDFDHELEIDGDVGERQRAHARSCDRCARRLSLALALSDLRPVSPPESLDRRIREAFPKVRAGMRRRAVFVLATRLAAAVLLLAVGGTIAADGFRTGVVPSRIDLRVVKMPADGDADEDVAIEEIYGPTTPVLDSAEGAPDAHGRR